MNPWQTVWAPNLNFPWSGSVAQKIEPSNNWFFNAIDAAAGDARIEKKAFDVASYGRQLGLITEVLLGLAERNPDGLGDAEKKSLDRLRDIKAAIDHIKLNETASTAADIEERCKWLKKNDAESFAALLERLALIAQEKNPPEN